MSFDMEEGMTSPSIYFNSYLLSVAARHGVVGKAKIESAVDIAIQALRHGCVGDALFILQMIMSNGMLPPHMVMATPPHVQNVRIRILTPPAFQRAVEKITGSRGSYIRQGAREYAWIIMYEHSSLRTTSFTIWVTAWLPDQSTWVTYPADTPLANILLKESEKEVEGEATYYNTEEISEETTQHNSEKSDEKHTLYSEEWNDFEEIQEIEE